MLSARALDQQLLVAVDRVRFVGGDEGAADIGEVGAHRLRRQDRVAVGDRAGQRERAVEPGADFLDQGEGRDRPGMAARAGGHRDQAVGALLDRLAGEAVVDDVVQHDAAIAVHRLVHLRPRAERGDDDRHPVADADLQVVLQPGVAAMDDLVDRERRGRALRMARVPLRQRVLDAADPLRQHLLRPRVQRGEGADDAGRALRDHQVRIGDDEQRRADHGQAKRCRRGGSDIGAILAHSEADRGQLGRIKRWWSTCSATATSR